MSRLALASAVAVTVGWGHAAYAKYDGTPVRCDVAVLSWHAGNPPWVAARPADRPAAPRGVQAALYVSQRAHAQIAELDLRATLPPDIPTVRIRIEKRGGDAWLDAAAGSDRMLLYDLDLSLGETTIAVAAVDAAGRASHEVEVTVNVAESRNDFAPCFPAAPGPAAAADRTGVAVAALGGIGLVLVVVIVAVARRSRSRARSEPLPTSIADRALRACLRATHAMFACEVGGAIGLGRHHAALATLLAGYAAIDLVAALMTRRARSLLAQPLATAMLRGTHLAVRCEHQMRTCHLGWSGLAAARAIAIPAAREVRRSSQVG